MDTELLATLAEELSIANLMYLKAHAKEGTKMPEVLKVPRPWDAPVEHRLSTDEEMRAVFGPKR